MEKPQAIRFEIQANGDYNLTGILHRLINSERFENNQ